MAVKRKIQRGADYDAIKAIKDAIGGGGGGGKGKVYMPDMAKQVWVSGMPGMLTKSPYVSTDEAVESFGQWGSNPKTMDDFLGQGQGGRTGGA